MTAARICSCISRLLAGSGFKTLDEGAKVSFEVTQGQKGLQATDVQVGGQ